MNKKLLTAAVGMALAAGPMLAAQAGVKVYGKAQVELASEDFDDGLAGIGDEFLRTNKFNRGTNGGSTGDSAVTVEDNARGRIGIKASEDLGGGLKGIVLFEWKLDTTLGGNDTGQREAFVGLQGSWGTFKAGNLKTPYKYYGGVKYDPFVATNLEARRNGGMTGGLFGHNGFVSNALGYVSPKKKGPLQFWVVYVPDEKGLATTGNGGGAVGDDGDYSAGIKFGQKNWEVFGAIIHNQHNVASGTTQEDYDAIKVGGMWKMGPHKILAQYEDTDEDQSTAGTSNEGTILFVGYHLKFGGNNTLVVQVGDGELKFQGTALPKQEHSYVTVGVIHKFSKKTRVFAGFSNTDIDNEAGVATADGERDVITIGIRKDF